MSDYIRKRHFNGSLQIPSKSPRKITSQKESHYSDDSQTADRTKRLSDLFHFEYTALNVIGTFLITIGALNLVVAVSIVTTFYVSLSVIFIGT